MADSSKDHDIDPRKKKKTPPKDSLWLDTIPNYMFMFMIGVGSGMVSDILPSRIQTEIKQTPLIQHALVILFLLVTVVWVKPDVSLAESLGIAIGVYFWFMEMVQLHASQFLVVVGCVAVAFLLNKIRNRLDSGSKWQNTLKTLEIGAVVMTGVLSVFYAIQRRMHPEIPFQESY